MKPQFFLAGYLLAAIFTFGIAWNVDHDLGSRYSSEGESNTIRSLACAVVWPLYLSVKGFAVLRSTT